MQTNAPFPVLYPLCETNETEALETQIKECFAEVFSQTLEKPICDLLCYGLPHQLDGEMLKKFIIYNGLSVLRSDSDNRRLGFLLKAWRVKNPKRGLHFLRTYLQLLYPNNFRISQLWQEQSKTYPNALSDELTATRKGTAHWLTSRVKVEVTDWEETGNQLIKYTPVLQAVIGARFLLMLSVLREFGSKTPTEIGIASGFSAFQLVQFQGECRLPPSARR